METTIDTTTTTTGTTTTGPLEFHKVWTSQSTGGWKWANTRGRYRVIAYDAAAHREALASGATRASKDYSIRHAARGFPWTRILWESYECSRDYRGGRYGCGDAETAADILIDTLRDCPVRTMRQAVALAKRF